MPDYGAVPPEITSALMYAGPGSAPMMASAGAWRALAAEITSALASYEAVLSQLAGQEWLGPTSASMAAAAQPHLTWMSTAAGQAEHTAAQATAAAAAYEAAHTAITPPAVVAANRVQHATLVATNFLGQNTAAIAANEAEYGGFWANNTATMYGYAASSAAASQLTPFSEPTQTTNPAGMGNQAVAVGQAGGTAAGNTAQTAQMISSLPNAIQGMSSPAAAATSTTSGSTSWIESAIQFLYNDPVNGLGYFLGTPLYNFFNTMGTGAAFVPSSLVPSLIGYLTHAGISATGSGAIGSGLGAMLGPGGPLGALGSLGGAAGAASAATSAFTASATAPAASATMGQASLVGSFSTPAGWAAGTQAAATPIAANPSGWAVAPESHSMAAMPPGIPAGTGRGSFGYGTPRYGVRPRIMPRPMVC